MVLVRFHHRFQKGSLRFGLSDLVNQKDIHIHVPNVLGQSLPNLGIVDPHQGGVGEGTAPEGIEHLGSILHVKTNMKTPVPFPAPAQSQGVDHSGIIQRHFQKMTKRYLSKPAPFIIIHEEGPIPEPGMIPVIFNDPGYVRALHIG